MAPFIKHKAGMTLMEVLIVVSIVAVVSLSLFNAFSNGLKVWRLSQQLVLEEDVAIFLDRLSQDLRNSFLYSKIYFEGDHYDFAFPTRVVTRIDFNKTPDNPDDIEDQMGRVEYIFEPSRKLLVRRQANYSQALMKTFSDPRIMLEGVDRVEFKYIYLTEEKEIVSEQMLEILPASIKVEVDFSDQFGQRSIEKYIDLPLGM